MPEQSLANPKAYLFASPIYCAMPCAIARLSVPATRHRWN